MARQFTQRLKSSPLSTNLCILGFYAVLSLILFSSILPHLNTRWIGSSQDPEKLMWLLRWTPHAVSHWQNPFFTTYLNYPNGVNLPWNTMITLPALLASPITLIFGPITAYNVLIIINVIASAFCAFWVIKRYVQLPGAAFVGGLLYGFSPFMMAQSLAHVDQTLMIFPPLLFLLLDEIVVRQCHSVVRNGILLGILSGLQYLTRQETVISGLAATFVGLIVLSIFNRKQIRKRLPYLLRAAIISLGVFLVIAGWPLWVQFFGPQRVSGLLHPPGIYVTDLANLLLPTSALAGASNGQVALSTYFTGNIFEWDAYLGIPLLVALLFITKAKREDRLVLFAAISALGIFIFSLGDHLHIAGHITNIPLPWAILGLFPLFNNIIPARFMVYVDFLVALLLAITIAHILNEGRTTQRFRIVFVTAVATICLVPLVPRWPFPVSIPVVPTFFADGQAAKTIPEDSTVLVAPFPGTCGDVDATADPCFQTDPMLWQALSGMRFRMPGGYFHYPEALDSKGKPKNVTSQVLRSIATGSSLPILDNHTGSQIKQEIDNWQVKFILVGPMPNQKAALDLFTSITGQHPIIRGGVYLWNLSAL